ncbi:hypothetical protein FKM82_013503 [Ascaphus truei]
MPPGIFRLPAPRPYKLLERSLLFKVCLNPRLAYRTAMDFLESSKVGTHSSGMSGQKTYCLGHMYWVGQRMARWAPRQLL